MYLIVSKQALNQFEKKERRPFVRNSVQDMLQYLQANEFDYVKYHATMNLKLIFLTEQRGGPVRRICHGCGKMLSNKAYTKECCLRCNQAITKHDIPKLDKLVWMQLSASVINEQNEIIESFEARTSDSFGVHLLQKWSKKKINNANEFDKIFFQLSSNKVNTDPPRQLLDSLYTASFNDETSFKCEVEVCNVANRDPSISITLAH